MLRDTKLSIHDLFFSKLIASKSYHSPEAKPSFYYPWYSNLTSSRNSVFSWGSRMLRFKYILQHGPFNLSSHNRMWYMKKVFGRDSFSSSKNYHYHHHHRGRKLLLTKLASYKNSILRLLDSEKPRRYPSCSILSNFNINYLVPSPGTVRHYHNYRGPEDYSKFAGLIKHVKKHKVVYIVGSGIVTIFTVGNWETIPYSKRKHLVLIPPSQDKSLGNFQKVIFVLPRDHPDSVRVRSILNQILKALQSDLKIKKMSGLEYSSKNIIDEKKKEVTVPWWRRIKYSTGHLEGLDWEVVVVDMYIKNAYVLPAGMIVVYKGLLKTCKSDAQVAAVIGHEVGHIVARHYAERFTKWLWFTIGMMIIWVDLADSNLEATTKLRELVLNPWSRSNEKEADYIGLLLMASAGYDPREAPKVYEMLDDHDDDDSSDSKFKFISDFFSELFLTHPSGKKRMAALLKPKVMEEAMTRFSKAIEATRREEEEECLEGGFDVCGS